MAKRLPLQERIERLSIPEPNSGCWIWLGSAWRRDNGYLRAKISVARQGQKSRYCTASRVVYEAYCGPIPDGLLVLHKCDNGLCVNPDHLYVGTYSDNQIDRYRNLARCGQPFHSQARRVLGKCVYSTSSGRYRAQVQRNRRIVHLGTFDTENEAAEAVRRARAA